MYEIRTKNMPGKQIIDIHFELESVKDYEEMYALLRRMSVPEIEDVRGDDNDKRENP